MNKITTVLQAMITTRVVLLLAACGERGRPVDPDQVKGDAVRATCYFRGGSSEVCITSFRRLQNSPESADGRKVSLKGYLAIRQGIPTLYATELDFLNDMVIESIVVRGERNKLEEILRSHAYSYVRVEGAFSASPTGPGSPWVGEIVPSMISEVSPMKQEDLSNLLIDVKHLGGR